MACANLGPLARVITRCGAVQYTVGNHNTIPEEFPRLVYTMLCTMDKYDKYDKNHIPAVVREGFIRPCS